MLRSMPSRLFQEWRTYSLLEPFGEERGDLRSAQIVTALANIHRDPKKRKEPYSVFDFMLKFDDRAEGSEKKVEQATTQPHRLAAAPAPVRSAPKKDWREMKATAKLLAAGTRRKIRT